MIVQNPFIVRGYSGEEYFCDRVKETEKIMRSLLNDGDVTLISPRRYGKTGLIQHVFDKMPKDWSCIYLDIFSTQNLSDFTRVFASAVVGSLDNRTERVIGSVAKFFRSCRPTMIPQESGMPKFSFDVAPEQAEVTLKEAFDYIRQRNRRVVIAIDEFQQILEYPEKGTEALLRSYIQFLPSVRFIFAGSRQHLMRQMFMTAHHPFYQSTDILSLPTVDREAYADFAAGFFVRKRKPFNRDSFFELYDRFGGVTWYVQMVLRQIWAENAGFADRGAAEAAIDEIVGSRDLEYHDLLMAQGERARALLRAVAADGCVAEPLSGDFISRHSLGATSTVASVLKKLTESDMLYRTENGYIVYDRFFGIWLRNYGLTPVD